LTQAVAAKGVGHGLLRYTNVVGSPLIVEEAPP
jgi:hypothetical protein